MKLNLRGRSEELCSIIQSHKIEGFLTLQTFRPLFREWCHSAGEQTRKTFESGMSEIYVGKTSADSFYISTETGIQIGRSS